jgi:hypothetical protein
MKLLKIAGGLLAVLIAVFVIGGLVLPKDYAIERSIVVDAPPPSPSPRSPTSRGGRRGLPGRIATRR